MPTFRKIFFIKNGVTGEVDNKVYNKGNRRFKKE